ncbi:hypothetical protein ACI65C_004168 [Semiaphis heraclei]
MDGKNIQKLPKIEKETKKSTQTPLRENQACFEDDDDEDVQALKNENIKATGLEIARSSCADEILMKTLIVKYTRRLMDKLEKIAVKIPDDSDHAESVARLRKNIQRLLKNIDQVGGPSTVFLNKYDCLRMAYYSIVDGIKSTKRLPLVQGQSSAGQSKTNKNCEQLKKSKESEDNKNLSNQEKRIKCENDDRLEKQENHEKRNNCENHDKLEKQENHENEHLEKLMKHENQEILDKCTNHEKRENHENNEKLENLENIQNCEKLENLEKGLLNCEYCGRGIKFCNMKCDPKLHSNRGNYQKNFFEWKSFLKRRFLIYFPCMCCMCDKSV